MATTTPTELADLATRYLAAPTERAFPYETFERLLDAGAVHQASNGVWLVVRREEALTVLRDDQRFSRAAATHEHGVVEGDAFAYFSSKLMSNDEPDHRRLRRLVSPAFTPAAVRRREEAMTGICDRLLEQLGPSGSMEVGADYAYPVAEGVICQMLGVPFEDFTKISQWAEKTIELPPGGDAEQYQREAGHAIEAFAEYVRELIAMRRSTPGEDIISKLIAAEEDGDRLSEVEMVAVTYELITAGHETTAKLIPNAVLRLLLSPPQLAEVLADPSKMDGAVAETLRFESSAHMTLPRITREDVELGGQLIPQGDTVIAMPGAANRDPSAFDRPGEFDISRTPNDHMAFGFGAHYCLGHALAHTEARIALERMFARLGDLRLATDEVVWVANNMVRGVSPLRVEWSSFR